MYKVLGGFRKKEFELQVGLAQVLGQRPHQKKKKKKKTLREKGPLHIIKGSKFYKIIYIF